MLRRTLLLFLAVGSLALASPLIFGSDRKKYKGKHSTEPPAWHPVENEFRAHPAESGFHIGYTPRSNYIHENAEIKHEHWSGAQGSRNPFKSKNSSAFTATYEASYRNPDGSGGRWIATNNERNGKGDQVVQHYDKHGNKKPTERHWSDKSAGTYYYPGSRHE